MGAAGRPAPPSRHCLGAPPASFNIFAIMFDIGTDHLNLAYASRQLFLDDFFATNLTIL